MKKKKHKDLCYTFSPLYICDFKIRLCERFWFVSLNPPVSSFNRYGLKKQTKKIFPVKDNKSLAFWECWKFGLIWEWLLSVCQRDTPWLSEHFPWHRKSHFHSFTIYSIVISSLSHLKFSFQLVAFHFHLNH